MICIAQNSNACVIAAKLQQALEVTEHERKASQLQLHYYAIQL